MKTLSLSEAKTKLSGLVDAVAGTDEEVVITRNGRPAAVLVSPAEFESWKETTAIRGDAELMAEVKKGLAARKVRTALDHVLEGPSVGKALKEELAGLRSYRVGRIRIIYRSSTSNLVELVVLGPRSTIYEETLRLVRKPPR